MSSSDARWVRIGRSLPAGPRSGGRRRDHGQVSRPGRVRPPHVDVVARPARAGDHLPLTSPPGTGAVTQPRFAKWRSRFRFPAGHPGPRRKRSAAGTRAGPDGRLERHSVRRESPPASNPAVAPTDRRPSTAAATTSAPSSEAPPASASSGRRGHPPQRALGCLPRRDPHPVTASGGSAEGRPGPGFRSRGEPARGARPRSG